MKRSLLFWLLPVSSLVLASCSAPATDSEQKGSSPKTSQMEAASNTNSAAKGNTEADMPKDTSPDSSMEDNDGMSNVSLATLAGDRLEFKNTDFPSGKVDLAFKVFNVEKQVMTPDDLKEAHEKKMHLLLVRNDITGFQHLHPEYMDGYWTVSTTVPGEGEYQLYIDISPKQEEAVVLRAPITIGSGMQQDMFPELSAGEAMQDDLKVQVQNFASFTAGKETSLVFRVTRNGQLVTNIQPYLGAFGHVIAFQHDAPATYLHAHAITKTQPRDGKLKFAAEFAKPGRYTIFAQFNIDGSIQVFPITVDIQGQAEKMGEKMMEE